MTAMTPDKVEAALGVAEDIAHRLDGWDRAYPVSMFSEVTEAEREWLHTTRPGLLDRISAGMGRHIADCIRGDIAKLREALSVLTDALAESRRDAELGREIATVFLPVMEAMRPLVLNLERLKDAAIKETP